MLNKSKTAIIGVGGMGIAMAEYAQKALSQDFCSDYLLVNTDGISTNINNAKTIAVHCSGRKQTLKESDFTSCISDLESFVNGTDAKIIFILAGLGGEAGSFLAPRIAKVAKNCDKIVLAAVTTPFMFEGAGREKKANEALSLLYENAAVYTFDNNYLVETAGNLDFSCVMRIVNDNILTLIQDIVTAIYNTGTISISEEDLNVFLSGSKPVHITCADGVETEPTLETVISRLKKDIKNASKVLLLIFIDSDASLRDLQFDKSVFSDNATVIFSTSCKSDFKPKERRIILFAGFDD